jgi:mannose-6-phosphate isomerase-like protein (cupin superfamily)
MSDGKETPFAGQGGVNPRREGDDTLIINNDELPAHRFEGHLYGGADVSFFLSNTSPGRGPGLHAHPYDEVFVVEEGQLTFTVGDPTIRAKAGQIVIVPTGTPHRFVNPGTTRVRHVDIHARERMSTEWLEEEGSGEKGGVP